MRKLIEEYVTAADHVDEIVAKLFLRIDGGWMFKDGAA